MGKALGQKWGIALAWAQEIKVVKGEWGEKGLGWWLNKARTQKINQRSEQQHNLQNTDCEAFVILVLILKQATMSKYSLKNDLCECSSTLSRKSYLGQHM